jgi:hypothetical protein
MADKEYIEREALREELEGTDWYHINKDGKLTSGASDIEEALYKADDVYGVIYKQSATADVVEVVRCCECVYWESRNSINSQGICNCGNKEMNYGGEFYPLRNDFCSYGERKNDNRTEN